MTRASPGSNRAMGLLVGLLSARWLTSAISEIATGMDGRQVATVARIQAFPGALVLYKTILKLDGQVFEQEEPGSGQ